MKSRFMICCKRTSTNQNRETIFSHVRKPFRPISASLGLQLHTSEFVHDRQIFRRAFFQVADYFFWLKVSF